MSLRRPGRPPSRAVEQKGKCPNALRTDHPATVTAQFQPLDPAIVNDTIPDALIAEALALCDAASMNTASAAHGEYQDERYEQAGAKEGRVDTVHVLSNLKSSTR
jgi:hypothetical protein